MTTNKLEMEIEPELTSQDIEKDKDKGIDEVGDEFLCTVTLLAALFI